MSDLLSPRQFAEIIGVSESSVRRWADDGQIGMTRTAGGHRKIARTEAIRFVRETGARVVRPDLLEIGEPADRRHRTAAFAARHDEVYAALDRGQADVARAMVESMYLNGVSVATICDGPLRDALERIGEKWRSDPQGIFIEHRATSICAEVLNALRASFSYNGDAQPVAIGGAPERDPYMLPSLMATAVLDDLGYQAVNLGPNTPLAVLAQASLDLGASLVWVSATSQLPKAPFEEDLQGLADRLRPKQVHVVVGGQAARRFQLPLGTHLHHFETMSELAGFAKGLLDATRR